jgi:hypothetical protein
MKPRPRNGGRGDFATVAQPSVPTKAAENRLGLKRVTTEAIMSASDVVLKDASKET